LLKTFISSRWFHPLLLLVWIAIGVGLRFTQLDGKPPWTDEFATLVFSAGNSFKTVPLDQAISLATLLGPLKLNLSAGASGVVHHLITEDHHPPLYFVLAHGWMQLFPALGEHISLWVARSLPAVLGVASIPAIYGLSFLAFRSRLVAQLAAAMMAVSPYGIFLTQEARHYALAILWVIASLCCLVVAVQHLQRRTPLPMGVVLCWVIVNSLGIATHYFFSLTLCAEVLVLMGLWIWGCRLTQKLLPITHSSWLRIYSAIIGTAIGCLVWVPVWQRSYDTKMTQWIMSGGGEAGGSSILRIVLNLINPIFQSLAGWITMLALLPVESSSLLVVIASGLVMLIFFIWALPLLSCGIKVQIAQPETGLSARVLGSFVLGAIAIFFAITYFLGVDLTRGARYSFVYFPAVIVLLGAALAINWNASHEGEWKKFSASEHQSVRASSSSIPFKTRGKLSVVIIWIVGLLSGITVVSNLGYQKYYRPDLLVPVMQKASSVPILIATTHNTLVQTGEMMGIAWEFKRSADVRRLRPEPRFLLAHQEQQECVNDRIQGVAGSDRAQATTCRASVTLRNAIAQLPRPLDLWLVNFKAPVVPEPPNCFAEDVSQYQTSVNGYSAKLYHCLADNNSQASR
jgi:uncharacterized membrane protein